MVIQLKADQFYSLYGQTNFAITENVVYVLGLLLLVIKSQLV